MAPLSEPDEEDTAAYWEWKREMIEYGQIEHTEPVPFPEKKKKREFWDQKEWKG